MGKAWRDPGANAGAVRFRAAMLAKLETFGMLAPWIRDGVLTDTVFRVAATFPLKAMAISFPLRGFPFNVQEFLAQLAES